MGERRPYLCWPSPRARALQFAASARDSRGRAIQQNVGIGENQRLALEVRQIPGRNRLKLPMLLHQENQDSPEGTDKLVSINVSRVGREIHTIRTHGAPWHIKGFLVGLNPGKYLLP